MTPNSNSTGEATSNQPSDWCPKHHELSGAVGGGARGVQRVSEYARLRSECPVAWSNDWGGYWTAALYDDVTSITLNDELFRAGRAFIQIADISDVMPVIPITLNPPEHTFYRRILNKYFTAERVRTVEPTFREYVRTCVEAIVDRRGVEAVSEFCGPVSSQALALLINLTEDGRRELVTALTELDNLRRTGNNSIESSPTEQIEIIAKGVRDVIAERKARPLDPDADLISGILAVRVDGKPLSDDVVLSIGGQVFGAGHQTTRDGLSAALYFLATNPGDQARLRADPSLIPSAVEEYLRLDPPIQETVRRASRDTELHGRTVHSGDYVAVNYASANRDSAQFDHPDACIIDRARNRHVSFGHGRHICIGAPLARMELRVVIEELLQSTSAIELDGVYVAGLASQFGGFSELPIHLTGPRSIAG